MLSMRSTLRTAAAVMLCGAALLPASLYAAEQPFVTWVDAYKKEASAKGISQSLLDEAFRDVAPNARVVELDRSATSPVR